MPTMAQLIDAKLKIDSKILKEFHQDLQCEKIKDNIIQTVETFPVTEDRIRRVLEQPEFEIVCGSQRCIQKGEALNFFDTAEKKYISLIKPDQELLVMNLSMQIIFSP